MGRSVHRTPGTLKDRQRRRCPPSEWVPALKEACFKVDENGDGYRVPSDAVIDQLLADGLSEWLPTREAVIKWYDQQAWGGWASSESCGRPIGPMRGSRGRFIKATAKVVPKVDRVHVLDAETNGILTPEELVELQKAVAEVLLPQDRERLVRDIRPERKDSHGRSFKFTDRFHPQTSNPPTKQSKVVMDLVKRTCLLEKIETLMLKYLRDRNVPEASLRRTEPKEHMFFGHCYGVGTRDGMRPHVDDVKFCAAVYCVSGGDGEPGLYWMTSSNRKTADVYDVPLKPGDLAFIISGTHHGVHHRKRKVPRITLNVFF
jgi:hypothetical protein